MCVWRVSLRRTKRTIIWWAGSNVLKGRSGFWRSYEKAQTDGEISRLMTKPYKMSVRPVKTRISMDRCPGWSEPSLGTYSFVGFVMSRLKSSFTCSKLTSVLNQWVKACSICYPFLLSIEANLKNKWVFCLPTQNFQARSVGMKKSFFCSLSKKKTLY